jgi:uncharacterized protein (TIGR03435 family)
VGQPICGSANPGREPAFQPAPAARSAAGLESAGWIAWLDSPPHEPAEDLNELTARCVSVVKGAGKMTPAFAAAGLVAFLSGTAFGQASTARPAFEVASVKPNKSGERRSGMRPYPERLTATNSTLKQLILYAYHLQGYQVAGPGWIGTERYDVAAKAETSTSTEQLRLMLQTLLAGRFKLQFHREKKELPVYWLVAAKNGPKLSHDESLLDKGPPTQPGLMFMAQRSNLEDFAAALTRFVGRPVLDRTGISGQFVFYLDWTAAPTAGADIATADAAGPPPAANASFVTALHEKFGLKLEAGKAPIEMLVIDNAEKPSEN